MPARQLSVIIIGGGIGGLAAAVALRRAGHSVKVLERSSGEEIGAGIVLGPCAVRIIESWGFDREKARQVDSTGGEFVAADTFEPITPFRDFSHFAEKYGAPQRPSHRIDLHLELLRLATRADGPGHPADMRTNCPVTSCDPATGTVTLRDGSVHEADLVVAADGVHSFAASLINGTSCPPVRASATTVIRFVIPTSALKADPSTAAMLPADAGVTSFYVTAGHGRYLVRYPCRGGTLQNFGLYSVENEELANAQQLRFSTDRATLRHELDGFNPACVKLADLTSDILPLWRCSSRDALNSWSLGRLVVLGDAAHPLLPNLGLGAVSAIEDAAALGVILGNTGLGDDDQKTLDVWLTERLRVYENVRRGRTAAYKLYSDIPMFRDCIVEQKEKCLEFLRRDELPESRAVWADWLWSYDVQAHAQKALAATVS